MCWFTVSWNFQLKTKLLKRELCPISQGLFRYMRDTGLSLFNDEIDESVSSHGETIRRPSFGYPSVGCFPAVPASVLPNDNILTDSVL